MDPTDLPSDTILTDATSSLDRVDPLAQFKDSDAVFPRGASRPSWAFLPPVNGNPQIYFSRTSHLLYTQSTNQGALGSHRTCPEVPIIHYPTTVVTGSGVRTDGQHSGWSGLFFPASARSPAVISEEASTLPPSSPTNSTTTPTRDNFDGGSWTSNCRDHHPQHQDFSSINYSFTLSERSPTNSPLDPQTHLPEIRSHTPYPQATTGDASPIPPITPQVTTTMVGECARSIGHSGRERIEPFPIDHIHPFVEAPRTSLPDPPSPSSMTNWDKIPQVNYDFGKKQLDFEPSEPVSFGTKNGPGINLRDALNKNFARLENPDDPMLQHASSILCRFLFPGYPDDRNSYQRIQVLNSAKERKPISRAKLAHEIAKKLKKYLDHMAGITPHSSVEDRWEIGQGFMRIDNMFLIRLVSVSKGSFQPEIWVAASPVPTALARSKAE